MDTILELKKATVYRACAHGWIGVEVSDLRVSVGVYSMHVSYLRPPDYEFSDGFHSQNDGTYNNVVVLQGWGHPKLGVAPRAPRVRGRLNYDPAYTEDFRKALRAYLSTHAVEVYDYGRPQALLANSVTI